MNNSSQSPCGHSSYGFSYVTKDPQKQALYEAEKDLCSSIHDERLTKAAVRATADALWETEVNIPVQPPRITFSEDERSFYDPWSHKVQLNVHRKKARASTTLHELAHAKIAAIGIGPFVESHGPIFCRVYGQFWSTYTTKDFDEWERRIEEVNLQIPSRLPNLEDFSWAIVKESEGVYAVRPAQRAVEIGWNIEEMFSLHIEDNHPMA